MDDLTATFVANLTSGAAPSTSPAELSAKLSQILVAARSAWPGVDLPDAVFVKHLAERVTGDTRPEGVLARLHATDLYLACACAQGLPRAIAAFKAAYATEVATTLTRLGNSPAFADEVMQQLLVRHLVPAEGRPARIAEYAGRGALAAWVRVAATRLAIDLRRRDKRHASSPPEAFLDLQDPAIDPELGYLRSRYAAEFNTALRNSFDSIEPRERNVLRMHFVDGLSIDDIGALYRVHRATAARWIAGARRKMLADTRARLSEQLTLTPSQFDSLMRLVRSELDVSLQRLVSG